MDPRAGTNLQRVRLEPSHSIPVVSINNNREERSEIGYEGRMMGSWAVNIKSTSTITREKDTRGTVTSVSKKTSLATRS